VRQHRIDEKACPAQLQAIRHPPIRPTSLGQCPLVRYRDLDAAIGRRWNRSPLLCWSEPYDPAGGCVGGEP
jgi:hypothetical protein